MKKENEIFDLGFYLNRVFADMVNTINSMFANSQIPINHSQFEVMKLLDYIGGEDISQQKIASIIGRDKAAISRALTHLEKHGYVKRSAVSGSKNGISLTEEGKGILPVINRIAAETVRSICRPISETETRQLVSLLKRIYNQDRQIN